jgi:hypothetical protein
MKTSATCTTSRRPDLAVVEQDASRFYAPSVETGFIMMWLLLAAEWLVRLLIG